MPEHKIYRQDAEIIVSILPPDFGFICPDARYHWELRVCWRGEDRWAVMQGQHQCLGADEEWDFEMRPSERDEEWLATHRFSLQKAMLLADKHAPLISVNGSTAVDQLERYNDRKARGLTALSREQEPE